MPSDHQRISTFELSHGTLVWYGKSLGQTVCVNVYLQVFMYVSRAVHVSDEYVCRI